MKKRLFLTLASTAVLAACASKPTQTAEDQRILRETMTQRSAVVTAGCVTRNQFGDDLLLTEASARMAERLRTEGLAHLVAAGLRPVGSAAVLVCPGHVTGESPGFTVKTNRDVDATQPARYPIGLDAATVAQPALASAYNSLFVAVTQAALPTKGTADDARQPKMLTLTPAEAELIRQHLGAERLWVVNGATGMVSFAKSFLTGMATGIATAATFGVGYVSQPVNASSYQLDLVDLGRVQRIWRRVLGGPGTADLSGELRSVKPEVAKELIDGLYAPLIASSDAQVAAVTVPPVAAPPAATPPVTAPAVVTASAPAAATALTRGQVLSLKQAATLRKGPRTDAPGLAELGAGSRVQLFSSTQSPNGTWWYAQSGAQIGWLFAGDIAP